MGKMLQEEMNIAELCLSWADGFSGDITVCDQEGIIQFMNKASIESFRNSGGARLIGSNLLDCHPEPSRSKLQDLLKNHRENIYTTEKGGIKKIIMQVPWFSEGVFRGLIEIATIIPPDMPHFIRK